MKVRARRLPVSALAVSACRSQRDCRRGSGIPVMAESIVTRACMVTASCDGSEAEAALFDGRVVSELVENDSGQDRSARRRGGCRERGGAP